MPVELDTTKATSATAHVSDPRYSVLHWKLGSGCRKSRANLMIEFG